jgi:hypothetical protein
MSLNALSFHFQGSRRTMMPAGKKLCAKRSICRASISFAAESLFLRFLGEVPQVLDVSFLMRGFVSL